MLRFAGALLPLVVFFVLFLWVESPQDEVGSAAALSCAFALLLLVFVVVLLARCDWKGAVALLVMVSLSSWLVAAIIGQAQGT